MKILIVDDESLIRDVIKEYAEIEGFVCDEACNGKIAVDKVYDNDYDLIIMDIMMPGMDGYTAIKEIKENKNIPIIVLSARKEEFDKLQGFDLGIDDFVTKPFSPKELIARIKAVSKRNKKPNILKVGNIMIDNDRYEVKIDDTIVEMTHTQVELLNLFLSNPGIALSRDKIIESIWGYEYEADDRTIDAHIKLLRNKMGPYRDTIKTVRKIGYKFDYEKE